MSAQPLLPVYLLAGSDQPKVSLAVKRLRGRFDPGSIDDLVAGSGKDEATGDDAVAALNALGLFGTGERLVVVSGVERWKKADAEAVVAYLASPNPGSVLALVGEPAKGSPLEAACAKAGDVLRFDVPTRSRSRQLDYPSYVQQRFERHGRRVDHETARLLVEFVGEDVIDHTPKNEDVRVKLGTAFDVVGERRQTDFRVDSKARWMEEAFEIRLRNHKAQPVEVQVRERLYRWNNWKLLESSQPSEKKDASTIEFPVKVAKDGETVVTYRVRYTW